MGHSTSVNQQLQLAEAGTDEVRNKEIVGVPLGGHGDANRIAPFAAPTAQPSNGDIDQRLKQVEPQYLALEVSRCHQHPDESGTEDVDPGEHLGIRGAGRVCLWHEARTTRTLDDCACLTPTRDFRRHRVAPCHPPGAGRREQALGPKLALRVTNSDEYLKDFVYGLSSRIFGCGLSQGAEHGGDIMKRTLLTLVVSGVLFWGSGAVHAEPITYTFDATGTGDLDGVAFTDAAFTITVNAETMNIMSCDVGVFSVDSDTVDISISGFPTASFLTPKRVFDNNVVSVLGFAGGNCTIDYLDISNAAFATYALATSIGPIFDPSPVAVEQIHNVQTTGGILNMSSARDVTFNALAACGGGEPSLRASAAPLPDANVRGIINGILYDVSE